MIDTSLISESLQYIINKELGLDSKFSVDVSHVEGVTRYEIESDNIASRIPFKMADKVVLKAKTLIPLKADGTPSNELRMGFNYEFSVAGFDTQRIPAIYIAIKKDGSIATDIAGTGSSCYYTIEETTGGTRT